MPTLLSNPAMSDVVGAQWLFCSADLEHTPTVSAGLMTPGEERTRRRKGVSLIYKIAERLGLMSHVVTTAALFFHRFFMRRQMRPVGYMDGLDGPPSFAYQDVALASLYLATKVEESYRKLDDIVTAGAETETRINETTESNSEAALRHNILWCEERLLETLCFDLIVEHPQKTVILSSRKLGVDRALIRIAYAHLHDAFRDPVCTFYEAPVLAAGSFALACEDAGVDPSSYTWAGPSQRVRTSKFSRPKSWLEVFDVEHDEVDAVVRELKEVREMLLATERVSKPVASGPGSVSSRVNTAAIAGSYTTTSGFNSPYSAAAVAAAATHSQLPSAAPSLNGTPLPSRQDLSPVLLAAGAEVVRGASASLPVPPSEKAKERAGLERPPTRHSGPVSPRPFGAPQPPSSPVVTRSVATSTTDGGKGSLKASYVPVSPLLSQPAASNEETYAPVSPPKYGDGEEGEIVG